MSLVNGQKLAHYEILEPIGKGGMGEVYRAADSKLGRDVAIKVLPEEFSQDRERLARFKREAKVLASLNHPNIASIYGLEQSDATHYLVLELVPGETLAERIARGPIPIDEALAIASKIAEGLEEAHEQGIVHRDLKPANVKLTPDDKIKVLDFGLAKAFTEEAPDADSSMSPTITRDATRVGVILGTAAYMSPEQAKGKQVDKRTDIFAFGTLLYEMLTGRKAFPGDDVSEVLASVIKLEPDWGRLPANTPWQVRELLRRALEKDRSRRLRDMGDARLDLEDANDAPPPVKKTSSVSFLLGAAASAVVAAILVGATGWLLPPSIRKEIVRFSVRPPGGDTLTVDVADPNFTVSPDGRTIAFVGRGSTNNLYVRRVDELEGRPLAFTDGSDLRAAFFSPDGEWLGFYLPAEFLLKKVPVRGGPTMTIGRLGAGFKEASWGEDGTIVFASSDGFLYRISADGGEPEPLPGLERVEFQFRDSPQFLPGGRHLLFNESDGAGWEVVAFDLETGQRKTLLRQRGRARFVATGHLVFGADGVLWAAPFDLDRLEVRGEAVSILRNVRSDFGLSPGGTLAYLPSGIEGHRILVWVDREGREEPLPVEPGLYARPRISPDGGRIAVELEGDIWIHDIERQTRARLTFDPADDRNPLWTPDGTRVFFQSRRAGTSNVFSKAADGSGASEQVDFQRSGEAPEIRPYAFTPDGGTLLTAERSADGSVENIGKLILSDEIVSEPLLNEPNAVRWPALSPDGRFIAYASNETERFEIYVRPFPDVNGGRWQIASNGGNWPVWAPDGSEIFYFSNVEEAFFAVPVRTEPTFQAGLPQKLFGGRYVRGGGRQFDITPDGKRFLVIRESGDTDAAEIHVVLNWSEELKRNIKASTTPR